jgi:hypothetical protein
MSASFNSLLGQITESLSKTAKPVISNENSNQTSTQSLRKRPREEKTRSGKSEDPSPYYRPRTAGRYSAKGRTIHDLQDLTVDISFLVIGAQKAGTSWLHTMLSKHPQLRLPECKELHFWDWNRSKGLRWYSQQFISSKNLTEDGSSQVFLGEITPCYAVLKDHHIQEIKTLFPKVKIIFVARDLADRAWSALCMELRNSAHGVPAGTFAEGDWSMEQLKSTTAVHGRTTNNGGEVVNPNDYDDDYFMRRIQHSTHRMRNDYATSIRSWLKVFPREQLLLLNYSILHSDPKIFLSTVCQHIGVDSQPLLSILSDSDLRMKINSSSRSLSNGNNDSSSKQQYYPRISLLRKMKHYLQPMQDDFNKLLEELGYQWQLGNSTT